MAASSRLFLPVLGELGPRARGDGGRAVRTVGVLALTVALATLGACGDDDGATTGTSAPAAITTSTTTTEPSTTVSTAATTTTPPATVEQALARFAFGEGMPYAGDCVATSLDEDVGAWCSTLFEDRGSTRVYGAGPTFSEYTTWLLLVEGRDGWAVEDVASAGTMDDPEPAPW